MQGQSVASGSDNVPAIATPASLATYFLDSAKFTYHTGETVRMIYYIRPDLGAPGPLPAAVERARWWQD